MDIIKTLDIIPASNRKPLFITKEAELFTATSHMKLNDYSQLPISNDERKVDGIISWASIGKALINKTNSEFVKDYMNDRFIILQNNVPLSEAISKIIQNEFVLVQSPEKKICGIVTTYDICLQFYLISEPFLLIEQIENSTRSMFKNKIRIDEIQDLIKHNEYDKPIKEFDEMSFGDYVRIIENQGIWDKLDLNMDRKIFIEKFIKIKVTRNKIMHFDSNGISEDELSNLRKISKVFIETIKL